MTGHSLHTKNTIFRTIGDIHPTKVSPTQTNGYQWLAGVFHTIFTIFSNVQKSLFYGLLLLISCLFFSPSLLAQDWEQLYDNTSDAVGIVQTSDEQLVVAGNSGTSDLPVYLMKVNEVGDPVWMQNYGDIGDAKIWEMIGVSDGGFALVGRQNQTVWVLKTNSEGDVLWSNTYAIDGANVATGFALAESADGQLIVTGQAEAWGPLAYHIFLLAIDATGSELWQNSLYAGTSADFFTQVYTIRPSIEGGYLIGGGVYEASSNNIVPWTIKTDALGDTLWTHRQRNLEMPVGFLYSYSTHAILENSEGELFCTGGFEYVFHDNFLPFLYKLDSDGHEIWSQTYGNFANAAMYDAFFTQNGEVALVGTIKSELSDFDAFLVIADAQTGNEISQQTYTGDNVGFVLAGIPTIDGGFALAGKNWVTSSYQGYIINMEGADPLPTHTINGNVFYDSVSNCAKDNVELDLENWIVQIAGPTIYYTTTDQNGMYSINVEPANYTVSLISPYDVFGTTCGNNVDVNATDATGFTIADFPVTALSQCPIMEVDVATDFLESCAENTYTITFCNKGTVIAENAYLEVQLDEYFTIIGSVFPWNDPPVNNTYTFELGDVAVGECHSFDIQVLLACDILSGRTHCVEVMAFPDGDCQAIDPTWDMSSIEVRGQCLGDDFIHFEVENVGSGNMTETQRYYVYEDNVMLRMEEFQLNSGQQIDFSEMITGGTFMVLATQTDKHPGISQPRATVEGCGETVIASVNTGFVNTVAEDDFAPSTSIDCRQNNGFGAGNQKIATPSGVYDEHFINLNDELDYQIQFQNTGTDTAHLVVVRDTLSELLDITSLQLGVSSHPYTFNIQNGRVLEWTFDNIDLPSSAVNPIESQGFVKFRISQQAALELNSVIENEAVIVMGNTSPTTTNMTYHTISEEFFDYSTVGGFGHLHFDFTMFPNPMQNKVVFDLPANPYADLRFSLFNVLGEMVREVDITHQTQFTIHRKGLPSGTYFFKMQHSKGLVATGKLIVQ